MNHSDQEKREYFRISGSAYLQISETPFTPALSLEDSDLGEETDSLSLEIRQFRQKIRYKKSAELEPIDQLAALVEKVHATHQKQVAATVFSKRTLIISGSGFDHITTTAYSVGQKLHVRLGFPDYPFTTIEVECEVRHSSPLPGTSGKFKTGFSFENISEENRDTVIKYVNQLQRKLMASRTS